MTHKKLPALMSEQDVELMAYFERTALPEQRIEIQLVEIERTATQAQERFEQGLEKRRAKAIAAGIRYDTIVAASKQGMADDAGLAKAVEAFVDAANAIHPSAWQSARVALINASLVREALQRGAADEAVEAALRAVNAWWSMRRHQHAKEIRYGFEGLAARRRGGEKRAIMRKPEVAKRNAAIGRAFQSLRATGDRSEAELVLVLAQRFGLSTKTIRRVLSGTSAR